jgi:ribose transport system substrate-binding protein
MKSSYLLKVCRWIGAAALVALLAAGCGQTATKPAQQGTGQAGKKIKVGYALSSIGHDFFVMMLKGIKDEVKQENVELIETVANGDSSKQLTDVEDLLQQGIDILILTPQDSEAIVPAFDKARAKKVPIVVCDIGVTGREPDCFIISDNYQGGVMAAEYMIKKLGGKGNVVHIQCQLGAANARQRSQGFDDTIKKSKIKIVAEQPADSRRDLAMTVMENILQAEPRIDGIFAANDPMATGALLAAKNAGRLKGMTVVGFNGDSDALKAIKDGDLAATIAQSPYKMGMTAVQMAVKLAKSEKVDKRVPVPVELVTSENLARFEKATEAIKSK